MISTLRLQNFRSYIDSSFEFSDGVNIIVGPNASGKTNLLEAILVLARGSSFRAKDSDLIQISRPWARLDGHFGNQSRSVKLISRESTLEKEFVIDDKPNKRLSFNKTFPAVYFEPNHLQLIIRGPDQRRDYVDGLLERSQPGFKGLSSSYKRTLAQRNSLLKRGRRQASQQLFAWDIRLSQLGTQIAQARQELVNNINQGLTKTYSQISKSKAEVRIEYNSQFPVDNYASKMVSKLETSIDLEFDRGFTAYGPHREDFSLYLNSQPVGQTASRGEGRSLLLALKIFELDLIENARDQKPLLLLDDVFSELDGARRKALVGHLKNHQTIITTTDAEAVLEYFSETQNLIPLTS